MVAKLEAVRVVQKAVKGQPGLLWTTNFGVSWLTPASRYVSCAVRSTCCNYALDSELRRPKATCGQCTTESAYASLLINDLYYMSSAHLLADFFSHHLDPLEAIVAASTAYSLVEEFVAETWSHRKYEPGTPQVSSFFFLPEHLPFLSKATDFVLA